MSVDALKLYEINDELALVLDKINLIAQENEGEVPDDWSTYLDSINLAKSNKVLDIGRYIKSLTAQANGIKYEIDRLRSRQKTVLNQVERLNNYLQWNIGKEEKYSDHNTSISYRKSHRVEILNPDIIPSAYLKIETTIMKAQIKSDIKRGVLVDGADIVENFTLSIK